MFVDLIPSGTGSWWMESHLRAGHYHFKAVKRSGFIQAGRVCSLFSCRQGQCTHLSRAGSFLLMELFRPEQGLIGPPRRRPEISFRYPDYGKSYIGNYISVKEWTSIKIGDLFIVQFTVF